MDSKNNKLGEEKKEVTLQELLEVAMIETTSGNSEKNNIAKTPWWLAEESLLGEVELDYTVQDNRVNTMREDKRK